MSGSPRAMSGSPRATSGPPPLLQGQSWDVWLNGALLGSDASCSNTNVDCSTAKEVADKKSVRQFATLPHAKAPCYGSVPIRDDFLLVQCDLCILRVKPLSFRHHMNSRHSGSMSPLSLPCASLRSPDTTGLMDSFLLSPVMHSIYSTGEGSPPHADVPSEPTGRSSSNIFEQYSSVAQTPSNAKSSGTTPSSGKKQAKKAKIRPPTARKSVASTAQVDPKESSTAYQVVSGACTSKEGPLKLTISKKTAQSSEKSDAKPPNPVPSPKPQISATVSKNSERQNKRKQRHFVSPAKSEVKILGIKSESPVIPEPSTSQSSDVPPKLFRQTGAKIVRPVAKPKLESVEPVKKEPSVDNNFNSWDMCSLQHPKPVSVCRYGATRHVRLVDGERSFFYTFTKRSVDTMRLQFKMTLDPDQQKTRPEFVPTFDCDNKATLSKRKSRKLANKAQSPGLDSLPDLQLAISSVSSSSPNLKEDDLQSPTRTDYKPESRTSNLRRLLCQDPRREAFRPMKRHTVLPRISSINSEKIAQQPSASHFPTINLNRVAQMQKTSTNSQPQAVRLSDITDNGNALAYASQPPPLIQMQPYPSQLSAVPTCHISPVSSSSHTYAKSPTEQYRPPQSMHNQRTNTTNKSSWGYNQEVVYVDGPGPPPPDPKRYPTKRTLPPSGVSKLKRRKSSLSGGSTHVPSNTGYVIEQTPFNPPLSGGQGSWHKLARPSVRHPVSSTPSTSSNMHSAMILDAQTGKIYPINSNGASMSMGNKPPNGVVIRKGGHNAMGLDPSQMVLKGACVSQSQYPYLSAAPLVRLGPPSDSRPIVRPAVSSNDPRGGPPTLQAYPRAPPIVRH